MQTTPENFQDYEANCINTAAKGERVLHVMASTIISPFDQADLDRFSSNENEDMSNVVPQVVVDRTATLAAKGVKVQQLVALPDSPDRNKVFKFHAAVLGPSIRRGLIARFVVVDQPLMADLKDLGSKYADQYIEGEESEIGKNNFYIAAGVTALYGYKGKTTKDFAGFRFVKTFTDPELDAYAGHWESIFKDPQKSFVVQQAKQRLGL